jgi:signal transduction histidine kinase
MRNRVAALKGRLLVRAVPGEGTQIIVTILLEDLS